MFDLAQSSPLVPVNVEIRHECYPGIGVTPPAQSLTYSLYMPDVSIFFPQFTVSDIDPSVSCPINYSLLNYADSSPVSASDPFSFLPVSGSSEIMFTAKY